MGNFPFSSLSKRERRWRRDPIIKQSCVYHYMLDKWLASKTPSMSPISMDFNLYYMIGSSYYFALMFWMFYFIWCFNLFFEILGCIRGWHPWHLYVLSTLTFPVRLGVYYRVSPWKLKNYKAKKRRKISRVKKRGRKSYEFQSFKVQCFNFKFLKFKEKPQRKIM